MVIRFLFCMLLCFTGITGLMAQKITAMSYNIHHGRNQAGEVDLEGIAAVIKSSGAAVVGLQEVDSVCHRSGDVDQMKILAGLTGMYYTFRKHFPYDGGAYGLGILSRYPITSVYDHRISSFPAGSDNTLTLLVTALRMKDGKTVHFATVHFDYRKDPVIRLRQSAETINYLASLSSPVILTGDLNAEPEKPAIKGLLEHFTDTDTSGRFTYPAEQPVKKIDYILISKTHLKKTIGHQIIEEPAASDHRPVTATFSLD